MKKTMMKKTAATIIFALAFGMMACGNPEVNGENEKLNIGENVSLKEDVNNEEYVNSEESENVEETGNLLADLFGKDESKIEGPMKEEDIVVKVGDREIPITSTWKDFIWKCYNSNWYAETKLYPDDRAGQTSSYTKKGSVEVESGEILVSLMPNKDCCAAEIEYISLSPYYLCTQEASILGITPDTPIEEIEKVYDGVQVDDYYLFTVDTYVTLKVTPDTFNGRNTVTIIRTAHDDRE